MGCFGYFGVLFILNSLAEIKGSPSTLWPSGQYGLPMPVSGCPRSNFTWQTGWRYQDTEDKTPSSGRSESLHIEGVVGQSSVNRSFCMKTNTSQDGSVPNLWPTGQYCIYKKGNNCPQGLQSGLVKWDDEDAENTNAKSGVLPEGSYAGMTTTVHYCCSTSGMKTTPIPLPVDKPFYLLAYHTAKCQQVKWALASQEWVHYDTENTVNSDRKYGSYPYNAKGGVDGHTIHYCYYTSCKYNLNASSGVFQSPNFPYGFADGQLCSWRITVLSNYVIRLKFTNFSLATSNLGDAVQIYDGFSDNARLLGSYHGIGLPSDVTSSSNSLYVVFRSDSAWNGKGFRAYYYAMDPKETLPSKSLPNPSTPTAAGHITHVHKTLEISTNSTVAEATQAPRISCVKESSSSGNAAYIVVPVLCLIGCVVIAGVMVYRWRKIQKHQENNTKVLYQARSVGNPSYFGAKITKNKQNEKEDEVAIAPNLEEKEDIYQEVSEKRIDNPLYDSQDNLEIAGNPIYQPSSDDDADTNILYQPAPENTNPLYESQDNLEIAGNPIYQPSSDATDTNIIYQPAPENNNSIYHSIPFNHGFDESHED